MKSYELNGWRLLKRMIEKINRAKLAVFTMSVEFRRIVGLGKFAFYLMDVMIAVKKISR